LEKDLEHQANARVACFDSVCIEGHGIFVNMRIYVMTLLRPDLDVC
jgi:hypothetical protein